MTEDLLSSINEEIKKHLPQQLGETLQKELARLKQVEAQLLDANDRVARLTVNLAAKDTRIQALESAVAAHGALDKRFLEVSQRENKADLLEKDVACAEARRKDIFDLVGMVFRAPVVMENLLGKLPVPVQGSPSNQYGPGSPGFVMQGDVSVTRTVSQV